MKPQRLLSVLLMLTIWQVAAIPGPVAFAAEEIPVERADATALDDSFPMVDESEDAWAADGEPLPPEMPPSPPAESLAPSLDGYFPMVDESAEVWPADGEPLSPEMSSPPPAEILPSSPEIPLVFLIQENGVDMADMVRDDDNIRMISVTLDEVVLQDVVRMFTRISGANIIATGTQLQGTVTVSLTDVDWKTALISILDMHDLALKEQTPGSEVYSVVPKPKDAPEPMLIEPIFLRFARVGDAQAIVRPLLVGGGTVSSYASGNALIVRSTAANLSEIRRVIDSIDNPRQQVFIEAKFLELNDQAIKTLGINWQVLEGYQIGLGQISRSITETRLWDRSREDASLRSDERSLEDTIGANYDIDNAQRPVGSDGLLREAGVIAVEPTRSVDDRILRRQDMSSTQSDGFTRSIEDIRTAVLSAQDLSIILSALRQIDGVSIVSNPKIIVANEEQATIHIGEKERPFISSVTPGQQGIAPVVTYNPGDEVDFGVKLNVTPTINTHSNITIKIEPELTRFVRDALAPNGQSYPIISTKTIRTVFSLDDGKTAAIGGLTETMERDVTKKIPLLGDIPLIGKFFFSHEHREKAQKETIIFVTVGLANPDQIQRNEGIPEDAELIHRRMGRAELQRQHPGVLEAHESEKPRRRFLEFSRWR